VFGAEERKKEKGGKSGYKKEKATALEPTSPTGSDKNAQWARWEDPSKVQGDAGQG